MNTRTEASPPLTSPRRWAEGAVFVLLLALVLPLAACAKKSEPAPPADEKNTYPRAYPRE
jgi:hypothetical protein